MVRARSEAVTTARHDLWGYGSIWPFRATSASFRKLKPACANLALAEARGSGYIAQGVSRGSAPLNLTA